MSAYRTKEQLLEEVEDLESALEDIYCEATSDNPDTDKIADMAADAVGIEGEEIESEGGND